MISRRWIQGQLVKILGFAYILIIQVPEYFYPRHAVGSVKYYPSACAVGFERYVYFGVFLWIDQFHRRPCFALHTIRSEWRQHMVLIILGLIIILHRWRKHKPAL